MNCTSPMAIASLGLRRSLPRQGEHIEIAAVFQAGDKAARIAALVGVEHHGGQVLGIGVDGEAEQHQLHHRDADHHGEGDAVAPHLDKFLEHDGP